MTFYVESRDLFPATVPEKQADRKMRETGRVRQRPNIMMLWEREEECLLFEIINCLLHNYLQSEQCTRGSDEFHKQGFIVTLSKQAYNHENRDLGEYKWRMKSVCITHIPVCIASVISNKIGLIVALRESWNVSKLPNVILRLENTVHTKVDGLLNCPHYNLFPALQINNTPLWFKIDFMMRINKENTYVSYIIKEIT